MTDQPGTQAVEYHRGRAMWVVIEREPEPGWNRPHRMTTQGWPTKEEADKAFGAPDLQWEDWVHF